MRYNACTSSTTKKGRSVSEQLNNGQPPRESGLQIRLGALVISALLLGMLLGYSLGQNNQAEAPAPLDEAQMRAIIASALQDYQPPAPADEIDRFALVDNDPYMGAVDAPVVIVEFSDFFCVYCKRHFDMTFMPLLEAYGPYIRYVYRDFARLTPESTPAAAAAGCAYAQGKFWEFHGAFFNNQDSLGRDFYLQTAENYQLDMAAYTDCLDSGMYIDEVEIDALDGQLAGVQGTPGFFINGQILSGAQPFRMFERMVQRELDKAGIDYAPASG